jgi:hypothetical protein
VADDDGGGEGGERGGRGQHMLDHRHAADAVQHLGKRRFQARALTGSEDDDVNVGHA